MRGDVNGQPGLGLPRPTPRETAHIRQPSIVAQSLIELLRSGQAVRFRALGGSMWPWVPAGSMLEVTPSSCSQLRVGELGAFERRGQVVVHRVRRVEPSRVAFAGDAQPRRSLEWVDAGAILGTARVVQRGRLRVRRPTLRDLRRLAGAIAARWFC